MVNGKQHSVWFVPTGMKGLPQKRAPQFSAGIQASIDACISEKEPYHLSSIRNFGNFLSNGKNPSSLKGLLREAPNWRLDQSEREFFAYSQ